MVQFKVHHWNVLRNKESNMTSGLSTKRKPIPGIPIHPWMIRGREGAGTAEDEM
jgi:hypothetical protein